MIKISDVQTIALSFPEVTEEPHFEKNSFRVKKKIFATVDEANKIICVKVTVVDQSAFTSYDSKIIYPVPNKWGKQGWTFVDLMTVKKEVLVDILTTAYNTVAPDKLKQNTPH